jgi:signal transduction histidine kinase
VDPRLARLADLALALGVTAAGIAEIWVPFSSRAGAGSAAACTVVTVLMGIALTQRRRLPLPAGIAVLVVWPLASLVAPLYVLFFGQFVPMAVAVFSMARHGRDRVPLYGAVAGAGVLLFFDLVVEELQAPGEIVFHWGVFAIVWGFGVGLRRHELRAEASTRRAVEVEVRAAEQAMAAVLAERTRIARELHDIVAHSVSTMVVQAGAAEQVVDDDPEFVRRALGTIRATGSEALGEMRRVVAMLRDEDEPGALGPQPGVGSVPDLVDAARETGLDVRLAVTGDPVPLPAGVDLAAYRIVQEALTNARRHARASTVDVSLAFGTDELAIEVRDDGVGSGAGAPAGGHGLAGMRERVLLYGGRLELGQPAGPGFVVRAFLPVGAAT